MMPMIRLAAVLAVSLGVLSGTRGDDAEPSTREAIDSAYRAAVLQADRLHLQRLAKLAATQPKDEAARTYEDLFRSAIGRGLPVEVEAAADRVLAGEDAPARVQFLAHVVRVFARVDRGAYRESLDAVLAAARAGRAEGGKAGAVLPAETRLSLVDSYFQKLVRAGQFGLAKEAMEAIAGSAEHPAVRDLAANRLRQVSLVGKPAPPIEGKDVDGRAVKLADMKGDAVLVVFWATWNVPDAQNVAILARLHDANRAKGFRVIGVNLDALQEGGTPAEAVAAGVRRFLLNYNVPWPTLIDAPGEGGIATAYDVTQVPSSYLIGRDGKVVDLMLSPANLEAAVTKALAR